MTTLVAERPAETRRHRVQIAGPEHVGALAAMYETFEWPARKKPEQEVDAFGETALHALYDPDQRIWVALNGKKAIGMAWVRLLISPYGLYPRLAHVEHLFVKPEWRQYALVGEDFDQTIRAWAKTTGAPLAFDVPPEEVDRWKRKGFKPVVVTMLGEA